MGGLEGRILVCSPLRPAGCCLAHAQTVTLKRRQCVLWIVVVLWYFYQIVRRHVRDDGHKLNYFVVVKY
jgi:hypothetical protein